MIANGVVVQYAFGSRKSYRRKTNQDHFFCAGKHLPEQHCGCRVYGGAVPIGLKSSFAVFDGMGGLADGEKASYIALKTLSSTLLANGAFSSEEQLISLFRIMSEQVFQCAEENRCQMGAAAAMITCTKKDVLVCNVGDCSVFRLHDGMLTKVSQDHLEPSVAGRAPALSQYLGVPSYDFVISPYAATVPLCNGDRYLLCSDGITSVLSSECIQTMLLQHAKPENAVKVLLQLAKDNHCNDDATVIITDITQDVVL